MIASSSANNCGPSSVPALRRHSRALCQSASAGGDAAVAGRPAELIVEHAGRETAEIYAPPERLVEARARAEAAGLRVRPAGPAIAIVGSERATDGSVPEDAVRRAASPWHVPWLVPRLSTVPAVNRPC